MSGVALLALANAGFDGLVVVIGLILASWMVRLACIGAKDSKQSEEGNWWGVLEVSRDASAEQIRRAYRRKIWKCHPDRMGDLPRNS
jgi:hypothetical protein